MRVGERIQMIMSEKRISQNKLAKMAQISQSGLSSIISGASSPKENTMKAIAEALGCSVSELLGESPPGFREMIIGAVPIVGEIACGTPITAEENIEGYADLPDGVHADFALKCNGDSMSPMFEDGDLVLVRKQPEVENGQVAAVGINGETTLKHVYKNDNGLLLVPSNRKYAPIQTGTGDDVIIYGLAVGYVRML